VNAPALRLGVHHLAVKVRDFERAERFYVGVLGLRVTTRREDEHGPRSIWLALGPKPESHAKKTGHEQEPFLAIERADDDGPARHDDAIGWHCVALGIEVEERDGWRKALEAAGHAVFRETPYTLYVRDPEGSVVALSHHPIPAPNATAEPERPPSISPDEVATGTITSRLSALVSLSIALLAVTSSLVLAPVGEAQGRTRTPRPPADVLIIGSSSVNGALGRLIESELARTGLHPERRARSSSGFSRPDFYDWEAEIPSLGDLRALRGLVVYAGGNDAQAIRLRERELPEATRSDRRARRSAEWIQWRDETRWRPTYEGRVRSFVDALCTAGARRVLVLLPAEGENEHWSERMERIQALQESATRASRCGRVVDPRGVRVREGATLDGIHLSRTGARAVWDRVGQAIVEGLARD
jgi:catechol 2,3-dioxygenase-like lactoylglutathione lyase family enzyme/lysophospholipase L1-like esterase